MLRRIIHSNATQVTKLEMHLSVKGLYHATVQTASTQDTGCIEQQILHFEQGQQYTQQFLWQYALLQEREGFQCVYDSTLEGGVDGAAPLVQQIQAGKAGTVLTSCENNKVADHDSSSLPSGSDNGEVLDEPMDEFELLLESMRSPTGAGPAGGSSTHGNNVVESVDAEMEALMRAGFISKAAAQRKRTAKITLAHLSKQFHLPINAAAKQLGICPTVLKKICRRHNMKRWPHRKSHGINCCMNCIYSDDGDAGPQLKSLERIITSLELALVEGDSEDTENQKHLLMELETLRRDRATLCGKAPPRQHQLQGQKGDSLGTATPSYDDDADDADDNAANDIVNSSNTGGTSSGYSSADSAQKGQQQTGSTARGALAVHMQHIHQQPQQGFMDMLTAD
eukprot:jgi/Chlat1/8429/Chrsp80S07850